MSDDTTITVMPVWGPGFEVSLDFYIHSLVQGNSNGFAWMFAMRWSILIISNVKLVNIDTISYKQ